MIKKLVIAIVVVILILGAWLYFTSHSKDAVPNQHSVSANANQLDSRAALKASARDDKRVFDMNTVQISLATYYSNYGNYPDVTSWNGLVVAVQKAFNVTLPSPTNSNYGYCYTPIIQNGVVSNYIAGARLETDYSSALSSASYLSGKMCGNYTCGTTQGYVYCISSGQ